jgi:protein farnesyltransferase/geranylgeranyltransferase type-1 subunit alpha
VVRYNLVDGLTFRRFRMATLLELKKDLNEELELMNDFAKENLKSYQVWWVAAS